MRIVDRLSAHTAPGAGPKKVESIEVGRGIAAMLVLLYHASGFMQVGKYYD